METTTGIKKILVVALDNVGDAVMATSVLKTLRRLHPQATVGLWVKNYAAGLFVDQSLVDTIHASDPFWDKAPGRGKGEFWRFCATWRDVHRAGYDVAFLLNTEWRRSLASALAGIPHRVGYDRRKSGWFLTQAVQVNPLAQHYIDDHRCLVEAWAGEKFSPDDFTPRLDLADEEKKWWSVWSTMAGLTQQRFMVFHLFSGSEEKNWPLSCYAELVERLAMQDPSLRFVFLCSQDEVDQLSPFRSHLETARVIVLEAPLLGQVKAVLSQALIFVGPDSGPAHVAAALGTPVLALFGDVNPPLRSRPIGRSLVRVLQKSPIRQLLVSDVLTEMESFLTRV